MIKIKYFILILALLFASSCENTEIQRACFQMIFSDALPVQFWLNGQETYNQKIVEGVHHYCFAQPFECSDEIKIQFDAETTGKFYFLKLYDSDGNVVHNFEFTNTVGTIWSVSFIPGNYSPDLCDQQIIFKIFESTDIVINGSFVTNSDWSNSGSGGNWAISGGSANITFGGSGQSSKDFVQTLGSSYSGNFIIVINFNVSASSNTINGEVYLGSESVTFSVVGAGTYTITKTINSVPSFNEIFFLFSSPGLATKTISVYSISVLTNDNTLIAYTDAINFKSTFEETVLIKYSNQRDFAEIDNLNVSPDTEFQIRIPAVFFEERYNQEVEMIELSNSTSVQLYADIKYQKLLSIGPMPFYMHRKLQLVLSHQFVEIEDEFWIKKEAYEMMESNKRNPLRQAKVWLSKRDYIKRNIL